MTNKEITEMIKKYESKWGRLGHTNIMRPELNHSGEEGGTTMSSMTNDLIAFRQKVAAGREANRLAHKSTVNVTDINRRYFEEITTNGTLIHAGTNQNADYKYYQKLDLGNGQSRYFYTKAEWDAYQEGLKRTAYDDQNKVNAANKTSGGAKAEADRENAKRNAYENAKSVPAKDETNNNKSVQNHFNNMRADVVNEYAKIAREASSKDAAKAFYDMGKGGNEAIDELYSTIQEGFKSGKLSYKDGRFETDDDQLKDDIEAFSNNIQKFAKQIGEASGKGREIQDELEKLMLPDIEKMSRTAYGGSRDASVDAQEKAKKAAQEKAKEEPKVSKEYKEELENNTKKNNYGGAKPDVNKASDEYKEETGAKSTNKDKKSADVDMNNVSDEYKEAIGVKTPSKSEKNESWKETQDKILDDAMKSGANLKDLASKYGMSEEYIQELVYNVTGKTLKNEDKKVGENIGSGTNKPVKASKEYDEEKENNTKKNKYPSSVKHSSEEPEIMDEYSAFMERVKKGREKNKLAHSIMISPSDLNARYEQSIKDHCFLIHSGNFKYYNKIDLGNGQSRYFYTKAEWDAYQDGLGQQKKADAPKKAIAEQKNNMAGYADWKKEQDTKKQQEETVAKNKAADEAIAKKLQQNSTVIKKQLQEQYEKNKEAAKHEGDRWAKTITEATKVADAPGKDAEIKPEQKQPPVQMEEQVKQEVAEETIPKDTAYTNVLNNVLNDQNVNDWAYICAIRSVYGANEENEKAVWELQAYLDNVLNQVYTEIGSMYGEAAITEIDGILGNQLQMLYQNYYNQVLNEFTMTANQQAMNQMMFGY